MAPTPRRGYSLIGMLVTLACIVVLFAVGMSAFNKAITGEGSPAEGTVRSFEDRLYLTALHQSIVAHSGDYGGRYITPAELTGSGDIGQNTTASLFSAMVMNNYVPPKQLISGNEYSSHVWPCESYAYSAYSPADGVWWDPGFKADLHELSNVSFAHLPLYGLRFKWFWEATYDGNVALLGNRGPKDGVDDPGSWTYGRNDRWGGHVVFADGHVEFFEAFTPGRLFYERDGQRHADNLFAMEDGAGGIDTILSFTSRMTVEGPELQFD